MAPCRRRLLARGRARKFEPLTRACADLPFLRQTIVGSKEESALASVRDDLRAAQLSLSRSNRLGASLLEFVRV